MPVIWKFPLKITDEQTVEVDKVWVKPLTVQMQNGVLCLWAEVSGKARTKRRVVVTIRGTGHSFVQIESSETYVGTVQDGPMVWHVYVAVLS